jgi:hypothetical protein
MSTLAKLKKLPRKQLDAIRAKQEAARPGCYTRPARKLGLALTILSTAEQFDESI